MKTNTGLLVGILLILLIGAFGYGYYRNQSGTKVNVNVENEVTTKPTAMENSLSDVMEAEVSPSGMMKKSTVTLDTQNNSGQSGTATLTEENGKVKVMLSLTGGDYTSPQPAHIHAGACPTPGAVTYPLTNVVNGKSETTINATMEQLKAKMPLAINVHKSAEEATMYTACGDIEME